jgi:hypothetical protein
MERQDKAEASHGMAWRFSDCMNNAEMLSTKQAKAE